MIILFKNLFTKPFIRAFIEGQIKNGNTIVNDYKNFHQIKRLISYKQLLFQEVNNIFMKWINQNGFRDF